MIGDLILEVNNQDIKRSPYNEVAFLLKTLPQGKVNLKIGRFKTSANSSKNGSKITSRKNSFTKTDLSKQQTTNSILTSNK